MNHPNAQAAKDAAIERVGGNANEDWKEHALDAVLLCARQMAEFTSEEVWKRIASNVQTHEGRAMGAVMKAAVHEGYVEATEVFKISGSLVNHRRPQRVWRSLVFANSAKLTTVDGRVLE